MEVLIIEPTAAAVMATPAVEGLCGNPFILLAQHNHTPR